MTQNLASMMYVPGNDKEKLSKLEKFPANAIIIDLEDAVPSAQKSSARSSIHEYLKSYQGKHDLWVRVNGQESGLTELDIEQIVSESTRGLVIPKIENGRDIEAIDQQLKSLESNVGIATGSIALMPLIESVKGIYNLQEIISASQRIICLAFGAGDYCRDIGIDWNSQTGTTNPTLIAAKVKLVELSRLNNLVAPHDGVYLDVKNSEALAIEAQFAAEMGFSGKHAIHPDQVAIIRSAFEPSSEQLAWATEVITKFEEFERNGVGAFALNGQLVDEAIVKRARDLMSFKNIR